MPTTPTAGQRVPTPDFSRAARLGTLLATVGWLVLLVGVVVGLFVAAAGDRFSVPLFVLVVLGSLLAALVVVGLGRGLQIVAWVGDQTDRAGAPPRLPASRSATEARTTTR
ncbi:hypothetical protein [Aquipuribacter sp. SD81]|uniref:hypothetical protein n=1 Tax=Aquipuribacter sp. SD81 TaxID=3127703 RepID=UPI003015DC8F